MTLRVGKALYGGDFATDDAGAHPFVLPGELLRVGAAGAIEIVEQGVARVAPGCLHFGVCGGCQYQHAEYAEQLRLKREILSGLLESAGLTRLPEIRVNAREPWGYRNRIRLRVQKGATGGFEVGYSRRGTNEFLPVKMCPIAAPVLWRAAEALVRLGAEDAMCGRWLAAVSEVEFFCSGDQSRMQMQVWLRSAEVARKDGRGFAEFCEPLRVMVPELVGAGAMLGPELGRRARRAWDGASWGAEGLGYQAAGRTYWVSRGAFFQVNRFMVDRLVELVTAGRSGELAWDLYAGVGLFSRVLAESFGRVVAVEGGEAAAGDLAGTARALKSKAVRFGALRAPIVEFLRAGVLQRDRPGLVVLDPPRAGLGAEGCELLSRIGAAEVVYVSCDPVTLARDLKTLTGRGYSVGRLDLVDLFPQTFHMETVVELRRA